MAQNKDGYTRFDNPPHVTTMDQPAPPGFMMPPPSYDASVPHEGVGPGVPVTVYAGPPYAPPTAFGNPMYGQGGSGYPQQPYPQAGPYATGPYSTGPYEQPLPYEAAMGDPVQNGPPPDYEKDQFESFGLDNKVIRRMFIRKVFAVLSVQLAVTCGFVALFTFEPHVKLFVTRNTWTYWVGYIVFLVPYLVILCCGEFRRKHPWNVISLSILTLAMSYMVGVISSFYDTEIVVMAAGITVVVCFTVIIFSLQTKYDFTSCYGVLFVCFIVLLFFGILCIFLYSRILELIYASLGALIFTCFLAVDTQLLLGNKKLSLSPEEYVFASLNLYLDIIQIFLYILRIFGRSRG
ncbi:glutamate receptor, ionotropic, N-methyl D-aspartate-associated protein 1b (glutamate binding) [Rhinichthys klamathensis goyatoka]|uniref:glutamate receptor, ionotropic, N-methyl D-aspartate-associated protein 1b (glutamate binding) n=1 Tax=Rhinichthys klamathensis goyatoka TaxID=3034132 RepID=UPI0024B49946|nr:glutamate receptor, ionotropic, N-methyl D-aspartate-associated protein 1b (glutamate binding) [Rhinichthys klamathensis goyatoka]